ncbi:4-hydroxyphenylpyruvate dioxygenase [Synechocystis sp. PCC 7509]|uniref:4-hydroxyphenylpyruvate dioxygenase n=1 Tax=Synechocystis sp. PCC 7509 TaxID=927677 RepID=UPI0002AD0A27|nr:4-hydroxyphenylpyruvate dioxygenase [Synechocystis sp. PCC 7509]
MKIDRVHFYVEDAKASRDWFINQLGFQSVTSESNFHACTEVVNNGAVCFVLSSPLTINSPVAKFLAQHPPGVADITFSVDDVENAIARASFGGAKVLKNVQIDTSSGRKWGKISAWGSLTHTLVEKVQQINFFSGASFTGIDHVVLNVDAGDLEPAVAWYQETLGFQAKQAFKIQTERSALHSQVMVSPNRQVQFPINQPASPNSQIQEFLDANKGAGIQHIALETANIISVISQFRRCGVDFLPVPSSYYTQLQQRPGLPLSVAELAEIAEQEILVDWQERIPQALLLQTFTQPIFSQPTFFLEIIERRQQARGFGEGNFRALFEAMEREQLKRGSLQDF